MATWRSRAAAGRSWRGFVSRRLARGVVSAMIVFAAVAALPAEAFAHLGLESSDPAGGSTLSSVPRVLRLTFTLRVELELVRVQLTGAGGVPVQLGPPAYEAGSETMVLVPVGGALRPGEYTLSWQAAGADGHPVNGVFSFEIAPDATGRAAVASPPSAGEGGGTAEHHDPAVFPESDGFGVESPGYVFIRWLTFLGMIGVIGAVAFACLVLPLAERRDGPAVQPMVQPAARYAARVGLASLATLAVAAVLRLGAQYYALHGSFAGGSVAPMLVRTGWGWGWLLEVASILVGGGGLLLVGRTRPDKGERDRTGWVLTSLAAIGLAISAALSGHAMAVAGVAPVAVAADSAHVLAAGGWIGGLLLVIGVGLPSALRLPEGDRGPAVSALANAFSPTALAFAGALVLTGVFAAWLHLGGIAALWESAYGRTLLLKLAVLSIVFATGAYNWLRVRPSLGDGAGARRLRRTGALEFAVGAVVLLITAVLVATSPPAGM